ATSPEAESLHERGGRIFAHRLSVVFSAGGKVARYFHLWPVFRGARQYSHQCGGCAAGHEEPRFFSVAFTWRFLRNTCCTLCCDDAAGSAEGHTGFSLCV